ncbi:antiviral reverse transcriptase Drt3a [Pseudomonas hormoni]
MSIDQAFSIKNLNDLLTIDREKGGDLEEKYIPQAFAVRLNIYELKKLRSISRYRLRVGKITLESYKRRSSRLALVINGRKEQHSNIVSEELGRVAKKILSKDFRVELTILPKPIAGKTVYGVGGNLEQILAIRFVQKILKDVYEIKMPSRDILVAQIKALAMDGSPKYILRADVESFYESVQHKDLLSSIHQTPELSVLVKRILTRVLSDYVKLAGVDKGLPRGVGVSAYLSEIYLAYVDAEVKRHSEVFYYARYVDDMLMMFAPTRNESVDSYLASFSELLGKKGLSLNDKTKEFNLLTDQRGKFNYLGYEFDVSASSRGVRMSATKLTKYRARIDKSFSDYHAKSKFIPNKAADELVARCLFLTGNMRLFNRKSNAFIGVYFSNKYITDLAQLVGLDRYLNVKVSGLTSARLIRKLSRMSFEKGFSEKVFRNFNPKKLSEISRGWKHA